MPGIITESVHSLTRCDCFSAFLTDIPDTRCMPTAEFIVRYDQENLDILNTGYVIHDTPGVPSLQLIADNIAANWAANIMPSLSNQVTLGSVEVLSLDGPELAISNAGSGTDGSQAVPSLPVNNALVIQKFDPSSRRAGRWFIPGVPEDQAGGGDQVNLPWANNLALQFGASQANLAPVDNAVFANRHKVGEVAPGSPVYAYAPITGFGFLSRIGSQSRRRS